MLLLDLKKSLPGELPAGWNIFSPRTSLKPVFRVVTRGGKKALLAGGNGRYDCVGHVSRTVNLRTGETYRFYVKFSMTEGINPSRNLLFHFHAERPGGRWFIQTGIFDFRKIAKNHAEGEGIFEVPSSEHITWQEGKEITGEVRIFFRWSARGKVWIEEMSLSEAEPLSPRPVRVACVSGKIENRGLEEWAEILETAGKEKADIVLLPETFNGPGPEALDGPSARLLSEKAAEYKMYTAGGMMLYDKKKDRLCNSVQLFDRHGRRVGRYDKVHPFPAESVIKGVFPGNRTPVFKTDFGKVGIIICYDSWFTDVVELLSLKGAEIILFPNAGYYRSLMPVRAADNGVYMVASSGGPCGIWDTSGREITEKEDPTCMCLPEKWLSRRPSFKDVNARKIGNKKVLLATLDLSVKLSPHNWGGPMHSAPGGRRNRREQMKLLYRQIQKETERWWLE